MRYSYCTLFDRNYLPHLLSLHDSLERHISSFTLYCVCMDEVSFEYLQKVNKIGIVAVLYVDLESHYPDLLMAKKNRTIVEYYFTCTSAVCSFVFDNYPDVGLLTYLDADLYFFSSPVSIYEELEGASVGIIEHKFSSWGRLKYEKYGKFNVGWISFSNNKEGRKCLEEWRINCLEWCYDRLENGQFADQKYLDSWPAKYQGVKIIRNIGANLGPWNIGRFKIGVDLRTKAVMVDEENLIFYHFASFKQVDVSEYVTNISLYLSYLTKDRIQLIYLPYLVRLRKYSNDVGIEFLAKNRTDVGYKFMRKRLKQLSVKLRRYLFNDTLKI